MHIPTQGVLQNPSGSGCDGWLQLSGNKKVTVSKWKNQKLVSIREYYEKDGEQLPGKKGEYACTSQTTMIPCTRCALIAMAFHLKSLYGMYHASLCLPSAAFTKTRQAVCVQGYQ